LLCAKRGLTVCDMLAVQKDVYSAYDHFLAEQVIAVSDKHGSDERVVRDAVKMLRSWNGQMDKNEAAPMITELLSREIGRDLVQVLVSRSDSMNLPDIRPRPQVIERLLRARPRGWVAHDDWDKWLTERLASALAVGRREQGSPVSRWRWGKMLRWKIEHPVGRRLPLVARFFGIGPVEMSGSGTSVKQTTAVVGPSERMVVDLGDLDRSVQNLVAGESGFVASAHYKDQWRAYYVGTSFPMQFEYVDAKQVLRVKPGQ
jgi:penicillin G amidase